MPLVPSLVKVIDFALSSALLNTSVVLYVRLGRARADRYSDADADDVGARAGCDLVCFDQFIDQRRCKNGDVEGLAGIDLPLQYIGDAEVHHELVPGSALELRAELLHDRFHTDGA